MQSLTDALVLRALPASLIGDRHGAPPAGELEASQPKMRLAFTFGDVLNYDANVGAKPPVTINPTPPFTRSA